LLDVSAEGLTDEQQWALIRKFNKLEYAVDAAITRSQELNDLWHSRMEWGGKRFWPFFWQRALPVLGMDSETRDEGEGDEVLGGLPYSRAHYDAAGKLYARGKMTVAGIKKRTGLSTKRAHRIPGNFAPRQSCMTTPDCIQVPVTDGTLSGSKKTHPSTP
jgi:hypothetical protein